MRIHTQKMGTPSITVISTKRPLDDLAPKWAHTCSEVGAHLLRSGHVHVYMYMYTCTCIHVHVYMYVPTSEQVCAHFGASVRPLRSKIVKRTFGRNYRYRWRTHFLRVDTHTTMSLYGHKPRPLPYMGISHAHPPVNQNIHCPNSVISPR